MIAIGIAALAASMWLGVSILDLARTSLTREERLAAGPVLGMAIGFFALYLTAASVGFIPTAALVALVLAAVLAGVLAAQRRERRRRRRSRRVSMWFVAVSFSSFAVFTLLAIWGVMAPDGAGGLLAAEHIWADTPFHAAQVTSFGYRDNFPPTYTIALDAPLNYPFLVNFVSGVLLHTGVPLRLSLVVVVVILQACFFVCVALITHRLTGSRATATIAAVVLFFLGNLGFIAIPQDVAAAGGIWEWMRDVPWSYTGDALGDRGRERLGTGLYLGNPVYIYLLPERSSAFGLAGLAVLLMLMDDLRRTRSLRSAALAGVLLGIFPRIHAHGTLAALAVAGVWFVAAPLADPSGRRRAFAVWRESAPAWLVCGAVAAIIALPQAEALSRQSGGFFSVWPGWIGEGHDAFRSGNPVTGLATFTWFWILNAGVLLPLSVVGWWRAGPQMRLWFAPFALMFVFANVIKTQPWEWDNNNFFFYWQIFAVILCAPLFTAMFQRDDQPAYSQAKRIGRIAAAALLLFSLTFGGLLSHIHWAQHRHFLWTLEEVEFAEWVRDNTPKDALVLTSNGHTHPVLALSGRRGFMGFVGWVFVHNLDWRRLTDELKRMYAGDVDLMRDLGVGYVVVGPWERRFITDEGEALGSVFEDPAVFEEVQRSELGGQLWQVLKLRDEAPPDDPPSVAAEGDAQLVE